MLISIIGIILILISGFLLFLNRNKNIELEKPEYLEDSKLYDKDFLEFEKVIKNQEIKYEEKKKIESSSQKLIFESNEDLKDQTEFDHIKELEKLGLTNREIAKKLNKSIREIDIILKLYG